MADFAEAVGINTAEIQQVFLRRRMRNNLAQSIGHGTNDMARAQVG
jgi:hypothetical protein